MLHDGLLVRDRYVEPAASGRRQACQRLTDALWLDRKRQVGPVEARRLECGVVHRGRQGVGDRPPDDPGKPGRCVERGHEAETYRALARWGGPLALRVERRQAGADVGENPGRIVVVAHHR